MPQAFWIVWRAKKRSVDAVWSRVPWDAVGVRAEVEEGGGGAVGYLKRKITP